MDKREYLRLLTYARSQARAAHEGDDLLQTALLAAVEAGRADMTRDENRRWLRGVLRNRSLHDARTAARRRKREDSYARCPTREPSVTPEEPLRLVIGLPPALRTTALLILTGHSKAEICWLLGVSDAALRKRISALRMRWRHLGPGAGAWGNTLQGNLPFGLLRRALLKAVKASGPSIGTHDPDGHLFVLASQNPERRQPWTSNT